MDIVEEEEIRRPLPPPSPVGRELEGDGEILIEW